MQFFVCFTSFMLTLHLSTLKASNSSEISPYVEDLDFQTATPISSVEKLATTNSESFSSMYTQTSPEPNTTLTSNSIDQAPHDSFAASSTTVFVSENHTIAQIQYNVTTDEYLTSNNPNNESIETSSTFETLKEILESKHAEEKQTTTLSSSSLSTENFLKMILPTSHPSVFPKNVTPIEETVEHNAILTTSYEKTTEKEVSIVVGHKCTRLFQDSILWNHTDGGMLALKSCPEGYQGNMYRPCFSNGKWGNVDYSECRLERLGRMRQMIVRQVQKGMLGNMYVLAEEFSKYISSVEMKSPMDRLEAFEILNTFLKLNMNLKMDKSRDLKYIQTLLHVCNELIKKKTVLFSPGSQENKLITEKAVEMVFDLTYFAELSLWGLLKTQKKQIPFRSSPNVVLYLYRGKLSGQFTSMNFTSEHEREEESISLFNLEKTLERSAYALIWIKGLRDLLSTSNLIVNSDMAVATMLSPLNSINHMQHPPTFDIGLRMLKPPVDGYTLECGQLWNMTHLWNTKDCTKASVKGDIVTCRCHHLGSIALLLQEQSHTNNLGPVNPVGKMISVSCGISLSAVLITLIANIPLQRGAVSVKMCVLKNILGTMITIQIIFLYGVNKTETHELCWFFAMLLHYMYLKMCCWIVAFGVSLLGKLRSSTEYTGRPKHFCGACLVLPIAFLIISFLLNPGGYETQLYCWMNVQRGILWSFVLPVTGMIMTNTVVMLLALRTFNEQMSVTHRIDIFRIRNSIRAGITLLPFVGINWFFSILAVENPDNTGLQTIFAVTNAMQGVLIFVFFCLLDTNIQVAFRLKVAEVAGKPKVSAMKLKKSGSFPILERSLMTLSEDRRRLDCTPLLSSRMAYHDNSEDPCCSNIRV